MATRVYLHSPLSENRGLTGSLGGKYTGVPFRVNSPIVLTKYGIQVKDHTVVTEFHLWSKNGDLLAERLAYSADETFSETVVINSYSYTFYGQNGLSITLPAGDYYIGMSGSTYLETNGPATITNTSDPNVIALDPNKGYVSSTIAPASGVTISNATGGVHQSFVEYEPAPAETTVTYQIVSGADDGCADATGFSTYVNFVGFSSMLSRVFLRFANLTIPKGATITSAVLTIYGAGNALCFDVHADKVDNSAVIMSEADLNSRVKTTAKVVWNREGIYGFGAYYPQTLDVTNVVAEITGRAGWSTGNALQLLFYQNKTKTVNGDWGSYEETDYIPTTLTVTYTGGTEPDPQTPKVIIERSTDQTTWTEIAQVTEGSSYDDTTVTQGQTYYYRAKKVIGTSESVYVVANAQAFTAVKAVATTLSPTPSVTTTKAVTVAVPMATANSAAKTPTVLTVISVPHTKATADVSAYPTTLMVEGGILPPAFTLSRVGSSVKISFA